MNRVLSGNIFEVIVPNDQKRYFQYVCKDLSLLNGDVIRVFSKECLFLDTIHNRLR